MIHYRDILWVEDFDTQDESVDEEETETKRYYDSDKRKYSFRVKLQKEILPLLKHLEDEKNFSSYSCAVLDINLTESFGCDPNESEVSELREIKKILMNNQIKIRSEHEKNNDAFKKNAGYYVYLYLVNRGMPPSRICMLTGNQGEGNLTGNWKKIFESAGIMPPKDFAKDKTGIKNFHDWLEGTLTPAFQLRSCIIGMSFYAEKLLDNEPLKVHLENLYRIPLRLSENEEKASPEFISALWQIVQPWESSEQKDTNSAYQMTLKTTRNWLAHRCLNKMGLLTMAFLFGIGMRGLLGETIRKKIDAASDDENIKGYKFWERELLLLIEELDKKKTSAGKKEIGALVIDSCREFFVRIKKSPEKSPENFRIELTTEICTLIAHTIGQKKNSFKIYEEDLLRCFLHGIYTINWKGDGKIYDKPKPALGIVFEFSKENFKGLENSKEIKYLNAVKNTLILATNLK